MKHDPDQVAVLMDISGSCRGCHQRGTARLVAYYSGEIIIRCNKCKRAGQFDPDDKTYNDPKKFAPFLDDRDDDQGQPSRYTKGRR
jgi:hypothetical protein